MPVPRATVAKRHFSGILVATEHSARSPLLWYQGVFAVLILAGTAGAAWLLLDPRIPLGVLGEWVWNRVRAIIFPRWDRGFLVVGAFLLYLFVALRGGVWLERREYRVWWLLPLLMLLGASLQYRLLRLHDRGMERWPIALASPWISGYYEQARELRDTKAFLADYSRWIEQQDNFHRGTHPPGLVLLFRGVLNVYDTFPRCARWAWWLAPAPLRHGLPVHLVRTESERAAITTVALGTWFLVLATVVPLYFLLRAGSGAKEAWMGVVGWPVMPAPLNFLPLADCLYPFLSIAMLALLVQAMAPGHALLNGRSTQPPYSAFLAGLVLWLGLMCSLAFLVVPVLAGIFLLLAWWPHSNRPWGRLLRNGIAVLLGISLPILALWWFFNLDLLTTWRINLAKHAGFYEKMPKTYSRWIWVNLLEWAVVVGPAPLLACAWAWIRAFRAIGVAARPQPGWFLLTAWFFTVLALDLSGRNLSEIARLWIFLAPVGCVGPTLLAQGAVWNSTLQAVLLLCQVFLAGISLLAVEPLLPVPIF